MLATNRGSRLTKCVNAQGLQKQFDLNSEYGNSVDEVRQVRGLFFLKKWLGFQPPYTPQVFLDKTLNRIDLQP